jgi:hypothetical protein
MIEQLGSWVKSAYTGDKLQCLGQGAAGAAFAFFTDGGSLFEQFFRGLLSKTTSELLSTAGGGALGCLSPNPGFPGNP